MAAPVNESWTRILAWLKSHAADDCDRLQAPASSEDLDAAAAHLGVELPDDFVQFYLAVTGTDPNEESVGVFPSNDDFDDVAYGQLALKHALRNWDIQKELLEGGDFEDLEPESADGVANDFWNVGWIPFADNGGGDLYCVDTVPTGEGKHGQVISHSHESGEHQVLAPSLADYLSGLADALEAGEFEFVDGGVEPVESDD